jgi:hypothetical protein
VVHQDRNRPECILNLCNSLRNLRGIRNICRRKYRLMTFGTQPFGNRCPLAPGQIDDADPRAFTGEEL